MQTTTSHVRHCGASVALALGLLGGGLTVSAGAASATVVPQQQAAGWLTRAADGTTSSWSTTGGTPALTDQGSGKWTVTFPGIMGAFGVPIVTSGTAVKGAMCMIDNYAVGAALAVSFHCTDRKGVGVKTDFSITYTSIAGYHEGWVKADKPSSDSYTPAWSYSWDGSPTTITRNVFKGVSLIGSYAIDTNSINVAGATITEVSPVGPKAGSCAATSNATVVFVSCSDAAGVPADMPFVAHYVVAQPMLAVPAIKQGHAFAGLSAIGVVSTLTKAYSSSGKTVTAKHTGIGTFTITFTGLASPIAPTAQAFAFDEIIRCGAKASNSGGNAIVKVKCFDPQGLPADDPVHVAFVGA